MVHVMVEKELKVYIAQGDFSLCCMFTHLPRWGGTLGASVPHPPANLYTFSPLLKASFPSHSSLRYSVDSAPSSRFEYQFFVGISSCSHSNPQDPDLVLTGT